MSKNNKKIASRILVDEKTVSDVAVEFGVSKQRVYAIINRVKKEQSEVTPEKISMFHFLESFKKASPSKKNAVIAFLMSEDEAIPSWLSYYFDEQKKKNEHKE